MDLFKELEAIELLMNKALRNLTAEQLNVLLLPDNWSKFLNEIGLTGWINKYSSQFDTVFNEKIKKLSKIEYVKKNIGIINQVASEIKNTNNRSIVGYLTGDTENVRSKLVSMVADGTTSNETVNRIFADTSGITRAQTGSVVNTAIADFGRTVTRQAYIKDKNARFRYVGGVIPTSSEECAWLIENQKPEGYTMKEIDAGIDTPFTHKSGVLIGKPKKIYWNGRFPNYNCIHEWEVIE